MPQDPVDNSRRVVSEHAALVLAAPEELFLRRLEALVSACRRDPFLNSTVRGFLEESTLFLRELENRREFERQRLTKLLHQAAELEPETAESADLGFPRGIEFIRGQMNDDVQEFPVRETKIHPLLSAARNLRSHLASLDAQNAVLQTLREESRDVAGQLGWLHDCLEGHRLMHPGAVFQQLEELVGSHAAAPGKRSETQKLIPLVMGFYDGVGANPYTQQSDPARARELVRSLDLGLRARVGTRGAHRTALERYAWGAMSFRRQQLRALAASNRKRAEELLTTDAAEHLFSQGFDVFTEVSIGCNRHDLVSFPDGLLIEAKQYDSGSSTSKVRTVLRKGLRQLLHYDTRLRSDIVVPDAYLLVFRLGGPILDVPREPAGVGTTSVSVIVVDLGESDSSGSNAPERLSITSDDLSHWAAEKTAKKTTAKKATAKKTTAKKTTAKRTTAKKTTAKKTTAKGVGSP